jgi:hypothetical protein
MPRDHIQNVRQFEFQDIKHARYIVCRSRGKWGNVLKYETESNGDVQNSDRMSRMSSALLKKIEMTNHVSGTLNQRRDEKSRAGNDMRRIR